MIDSIFYFFYGMIDSINICILIIQRYQNIFKKCKINNIKLNLINSKIYEITYPVEIELLSKAN